MAGPLWMNLGKLVMAAGKAVLCAACPCVVVPPCCNATAAGPGLAPATLYVTLTGTGCIDGTYPVAFRNPAAPYLQFPVCWESAEQSCGYNSFFLCLSCGEGVANVWQLDVITRLAGGGYTGINSHVVLPSPSSCSPFALSAAGLTWQSPSNQCCVLGTTNVSVTP